MNKDLLYNLTNQIKQAFIKSIVAVVVLFVSWLIVMRLPMLNSINSPFDFEIKDLLSAIILALCAIIIYKLGKDTVSLISYRIIGTILRDILNLIAVVIGYYALVNILPQYLDKIKIEWLFYYGFLGLFLFILGSLAYKIYNKFDELLTISKSNNNNSYGTQVNKVVLDEVATSTEANQNILTCGQCTTVLEEGSSFCTNCGDKIN